MAANDIQNITKGRSVIRVTSTAATCASPLIIPLTSFQLDAKTDANAQIAVTETVNTIDITRVIFSSNNTNSFWRISRGNNNPILELSGNGDWNLSERGLTISANSSSNLQIQLITSGGVYMGGTILVQVSKQATYSPAI